MKYKQAIDKRLGELESGLREVIRKMKSFRQEVPSSRVKQVRLELSAILNHRNSSMSAEVKMEFLLMKLKDTVEVLNAIRQISGSAKLEETHAYALKLLIEHTDCSNR